MWREGGAQKKALLCPGGSHTLLHIRELLKILMLQVVPHIRFYQNVWEWAKALIAFEDPG